MQADVEVTPEKAKELEPLIANHKSHITRLEQVMRLLANEQVIAKLPYVFHAQQLPDLSCHAAGQGPPAFWHRPRSKARSIQPHTSSVQA